MPKDLFESEYEALGFDMNVMLLGMAAEIKARDEAVNKHNKGQITTRRQALELAHRARTISNG